MESYTLKISTRESGSLLQNKRFVPIDGPFLSISNSTPYKTIVKAAWSKCGQKIAACDAQGQLYIFDFIKNRFYLVYRFSICSTFIIFSSVKEIIIALADCNIIAVNIESKCIRKNFTYHTSNVTCISFDKTRLKALSASKDEAIIWDLTSFNILRLLTLKRNIDIVKVCFLPDKDIILSSFKDSSVMLWDSMNFKCISRFVCTDGDDVLNLKTVDYSWDGNLIACAGKSNWFLVWSSFEQRILCTASLPLNIMVKQVNFFPSLPGLPNNNYVLTLLTSDSSICIYKVQNMELLHTIKSSENKIIFYSNSPNNFQLCATTLQGNLDVYDLEPFLLHDDGDEQKSKTVPKGMIDIAAEKSKTKKKEVSKKKKKMIDVDKVSLRCILKNFGEYPERYRFFIWSQLLDLPRNVDAFKVLHEESLQISPFIKEYPFMNPGVQKTFLRVMSMLARWFPVIKEVEYYQCIVFPFVKVLHKNTILCVEVLITFISNWCQNWFMFPPFPPFNILCLVENLITFHDVKLMAHFIKNNISPEIYAWSLLQTSFSEVLNKKQWLKLWDHIFSNPPSFLLYSVVAFNIVMREVLFRCQTIDEFKQCYRKHGVSSSVILEKAYYLHNLTPDEMSPDPVIGKFLPLPKGPYPSFMQLSKMIVDLQTHDRKTLIDQEIDFLNQKNVLEIRSNYLLELQKLQLMRRKMFMENNGIENSEALSALSKKLKNVQGLIQENLTDQITMLKGRMDYNFAAGTEDYKTQFFEFKNYLRKLRAERKET